MAARIPNTATFAALMIAVGCASQTGREPVHVEELASAVEVELALPNHGFQLETLGAAIEAGDDIRWCEVVGVPGEPGELIRVDRIETAMGEQGTDLVLSAAPVGSPTAAVMDVGARVPCLRAGEAFGEELEAVTATQHLYNDLRYPDGVGRVFEGGQKLVVEYHYDNPTSEPVMARAKINFHVSRADELAHIARLATFENLTIYTPPLGQSTHVAECTVTEPMIVGELVRFTRRFGTDFRVWIRGGVRDGELVWHSRDHRDTNLELSDPITLLPGEGLRFQCSYRNFSTTELRFGTSASDELCSLQAIFWHAEGDARTQPQDCLLLDVDEDGVARN